MKEDKSYQKKVLVSSMLGLGLEGMDILLLSFALSSIIREFHISSAAGGVLPSITNIGMLVGGVIFGYWADRKGRIKVFTYTIFIFAIGTFLMAFAQSIAVIYVLRFIVGLGAGGEYGIGMALVAEAFPKERRGQMSAWITVGGQMGTLVAALLVAIVTPFAGWRGAFIFGVIPVILAYFVRRHLPETKSWQDTHAADVAQHVQPRIRLLVNTPKTALITLGLTIMSAVQVAGYYGLMNWLPSMLEKKEGLSVSGSSLWMISTIIGMSLGMLTFGKLFDKFGSKVTYSVFLIMAGLSVALYAFVHNVFLMLLVGAVVGFFANGMNAGYGALISSFYPTEIRSFANNAIFNTGRAVGGLSPILVGYIIDRSGFTAALLCIGALYIVSLVIVNLIPNPVKNKVKSGDGDK
ncbi:MFS transporter [Bifidobacterium sp. ESL0732]|uniref:MFS transporter n=1 Tax=Bifidobacterium sp. ESL0732 TaxID=2983222 RepID=UPI0023F81B14|nr:MFS transporter [Bifidobacterium sp. ESL0732]WEV64801.1 MFS transporter [Bifidobacterium sp. ESL0732]